MIIRITYSDQRLDIFDTTPFTAAMPLGRDNMLTNFEVRFDSLGDGGLWVAAHGYLATGAEEQDGGEAPVARRKRGWRFLVASAEELERVELVVVDGEAILKRVLGELVDLQAFDEAAYECIGSSSKGLHERIAQLHGYLCLINGTDKAVVPGIPDKVLCRVLEAHGANKGTDGDEEEDWGDLDEAGW